MFRSCKQIRINAVTVNNLSEADTYSSMNGNLWQNNLKYLSLGSENHQSEPVINYAQKKNAKNIGSDIYVIS